jgi:ATP-dependent Zn protease
MLKKPELQIQEQFVNALLIEMDGFKENTGVFVTPQMIFTKQNQKQKQKQPQNPIKNINVELSDKEPREIILCINVCNENLIVFYIHANNLYIGVYCYHNL